MTRAVIVGSGIVDKVANFEKNGTETMVADVENYVRSLKAATMAVKRAL